MLLTGDHESVAQSVAAELGIDEVIAQVTPADEAEQIRPTAATERRTQIGSVPRTMLSPECFGLPSSGSRDTSTIT